MKKIHLSTIVLLLITGCLQVAFYIRGSSDVGSHRMLVSGIIYVVIGLLFFTQKKYTYYIAISLPFIRMITAYIKFGFPALISVTAYKNVTSMITLTVIDLIVIICCAFLILSRKKAPEMTKLTISNPTKTKKGYKRLPLSSYRQAVIASASVTKEKNAIHSFTEVDITEPRHLIKEHFERTGEKLSLTAYIVICLAQVIKQHPQLNSFIKGRKLIILDDVTVSVLIEREMAGEKVPEPLSIKGAQGKSFRQIHEEIKEAKRQQSDKLGSLSDTTWIRLVPNFLLKTFIRIADKNIHMAKTYGKVAVTAVGMFSKEAVWFIPHGSATVLITVGSISQKVIEFEGHFVSREHLCLTVSFDHNIVDGAPASRFMNQLVDTIKSGNLLHTGVDTELQPDI